MAISSPISCSICRWGFFGGILSGRGGAAKRIGIVIFLGGALSLTIELIQFYDVGRETAASDVYANILGTILGAAGGRVFGRDRGWSFLNGVPSNPVPTLLLAAWLGYRLYPYVPTIDLHKYWNALKPVFLHPSAPPYAIFRQTAIWLSICLLIEKIALPRQAAVVYAAFSGLILAASILIISVQVTAPQLAGMALAFFIWRLLAERWQGTIAVALLALYVTALRLEPFRFAPEAAHFTWIPFVSFMRGSIDIDVQSFCEKFFLYGSLIWLLVQVGLRLAAATGLVAAMLFITSCVEIYLPGRSAEITDAMMALGIGGMMALLSHHAPAAVSANTLTGRIRAAAPPALNVRRDLRPTSIDQPPCPSPPLA